MPSDAPPNNFPRMVAEIRNLALKLRDSDDREERGRLADKAIRRLERLERRIALARQATARKGGLKTAERGPEYFRQIAAMRKTRAGGRPKKQAD
jgi:hypothetical protein